MGEQPTGNLRHIAAAANARQQALKARGVEFRAFSRRRFSVSGIRYDLCLHVWPEGGFDDFTWTGFRRSWFGLPRPVDDVEREVNAVLDRYAAGAEPPFPTFD